MGDNNYIGPYCLIGFPPEHADFFPETTNGVIIGNNNVITGHVTIDSGAFAETCIGDNNFIMKHVHIGHDCIIDNHVRIAPNASIGGHTSLMDYCNIGMGAMVHQNQVIGKACMIGMGAIIGKKLDTGTYNTIAGNPARVIGRNTYLLEKHNI
jgi:UDP-N-acetylglucosamine acyltransferase